jgi:hypothetical protein
VIYFLVLLLLRKKDKKIKTTTQSIAQTMAVEASRQTRPDVQNEDAPIALSNEANVTGTNPQQVHFRRQVKK